MSSVLHALSVRRFSPSFHRAFGAPLARVAAALRRRIASLDEDRMPDWQLRDLGFRDGRDAAGRRGPGP